MGQPTYPSPQTPPQMPPPAQPNAVVTFLQSKRAFPTWALIVAILLACSLGYASHGGATATDTSTATASTTTSSSTNAAPTATKPPAATATPAKPVIITSFSGTGAQNTVNFHVNASQWTLLWQCQGGQYGGNLAVEVDNADGSTLDYGAVNEICNGSMSGSTIERASGDFYLSVNADIAWQIQIQAMP